MIELELNLDQLESLAKHLAPLLKPNMLVYLDGEMGCGKTTFASVLCKALGIDAFAGSPTFAIANSYQGRIRVHHLDVYRLLENSYQHSFDLDRYLEDETALVLLEWGHALNLNLPGLTFAFSYATESSKRCVTLIAPEGIYAEKYHAIFTSLSAIYKR